MALTPLADRVLVERIEEQAEKTSGGIIIPDSAKEKPQEGLVRAIGSGRVKDNGERQPIDLEVGNKVLFGKYSGTEIKFEGNEFLILREDDILAKIG